MTKRNKGVIIAYQKGYRVIDGEVISPFSGKALKLKTTKCGKYSQYKRVGFSVRSINNKNVYAVMVHKLVAYQKFGEALFEEGVVVRHLDSNSLNNMEDNIEIGSISKNTLDMPKYKRVERAITASTKIRKFSDEEVKVIRKEYNNIKSYKKVMDKFNITSKGTLFNILNNEYVTIV